MLSEFVEYNLSVAKSNKTKTRLTTESKIIVCNKVWVHSI